MPYRYEDLMAELARIGLLLSHCYFVSAITVDGLTVGQWVEESSRDAVIFGNATREDMVSPMGTAILSLSERITTELDVGDYRLAVMKGADATFIQVAVNEDYVLFLGVHEIESIDRVVSLIRREWGELQKLLEK